MTTAQLAQKSRLSERAAQNAVTDLVALGELSAVISPGRGKRNRYSPCTVNPAESAGFEGGNPAESAPFTETPQNLHPFNPAESAGFTAAVTEEPQVSGNPAESAGFEISDERSTSVVSGRRSTTSSSSEAVPRPDVDRLCAHLADRIEANGSNRPAITKKWRDAARLMIDKDGRTEDQIHKAIDWCQDNEFWHTNILSMPTLRDKYEQLRLKAKAEAEREKREGNRLGQRPRRRGGQAADLISEPYGQGKTRI